MWGKRDKLSSTALARLPQGNLRSAAARTDDGLTGCRIWRSAVVHCCQFDRLRDRGVVVLRLVYAPRDRPHPLEVGRAGQARSFVRQSFGPRIGGEDGDRPGVSPDRLLGGDECWFGEPAGQVAATPIWLMNCCATLAETFGPQLGYGRHPAIPLPNFPCAWPTHPPSANKPITRQRARRSWMAAT